MPVVVEDNYKFCVKLSKWGVIYWMADQNQGMR
jgi:hypothetical protein